MKILLVHEVAEMLRVSVPTVNRWLGEARRGAGSFPLPISTTKGKGRWIASDVEAWIACQSRPSVTPPKSVKQKRRNAKAFQERQATAERGLDRYRTNKHKGGA